MISKYSIIFFTFSVFLFIFSCSEDNSKSNELKPQEISLVEFYNASYEGIEYSLYVNKTKINSSDDIIHLIADINIDEGYYIQSSDSTLSLAPSEFVMDDGSAFKNLNQIIEPEPDKTYDKIFNQNIGKHFNRIKLDQKIVLKGNYISADKYNLKGAFSYQVCNKLYCISHWDVFDFQINSSLDVAKQGTDMKLLKKITVLEEKLKEKVENKFVIINNPTALSRIVKIKGLEDQFQSSSNIVKTLVVYGREPNLKAIVSYDGAKYTVLQGDSIAGGIIEVIDHEKLVFVKDSVKKMHYYNKK